MNRRRTNDRCGSDMLVHAWRSLFIVTALAVSLMVAYFPGSPPAANAETAPTPSAEVATAEPATEPPQPEATPDLTPPATPAPSPEPTPEPTPSPTPTPPPSLTGVAVELNTDLPEADSLRVDPGARVALTASVSSTADLTEATLTISLPDGWLVVDSGAGEPDPSGRSVAWVLETVPSATGVTRRVVLSAPETAAEGATAEHQFGVRLQVGADFIDGAPLVVIVAPPVSVVSVSAGRVIEVGEPPVYLDPGEPLREEPRFQVFRLRFEIVNAAGTPFDWLPLAEYAAADGAAFRALPQGEAVAGLPFYAAPEWIRMPGGGTVPGPTSAWQAGQDGAPDTYRSMGLNPMSSISLASRSTTLVEFSVRATVDAEFETAYLIRLTDAGMPLLGATEATIVLASRPPVILSPGQQSGVPADEPRTLRASWTTSSLHSPSYDLATDTCAACHRAHVAQGTLLTTEPTEYSLCISCHNGVDAPDVASAYASVPANDPLTRSYYQHDPTTVTGPLGTANACSECHNPHDSTATAPVMGADGWTASGRIAGASGVSVTNGPGAVTYALVSRVSLEYQLCFKCHSGSAQLPSNVGQPPSRMALDKGIEFDPRNPSFHPIEAPGTNLSDQINASLAATGTSPYKRWVFDRDSTIRCVNCHADSRLSPRTPEGVLKPPDTNLPAHASPERGILIEPYRDRTLMDAIEPYDAADFALCYVCHAEAPFRDTSGEARVDTNFQYHGLHVSSEEVQDHGTPTTNIDVAGSGAGLAICAECHFRIHSTAFSVDGQAPGARLVNFAPNVTGRTGLPISWQLKTATTPGSCSLRCHGEAHTATY